MPETAKVSARPSDRGDEYGDCEKDFVFGDSGVGYHMLQRHCVRIAGYDEKRQTRIELVHRQEMDGVFDEQRAIFQMGKTS
jgi:hypothetical protein